MSASPHRDSMPGPERRQENIVDYTLAGLTAASLKMKMSAQSAFNTEVCPEELIFRNLQGQLGIIGTDGRGYRTLELGRTYIVSWGIGPAFADGQRIILVGFGHGIAWKGQPKTHSFIYDRKSGEIEEITLPDLPAPYTIISCLFQGEERILFGIQVEGEMQLFSCRLDGSELRPVTQPGQGFTYGETLSPNQKRIAFHAVCMTPDVNNRYAIFTANPDGSERILVDRDEDAYCFGPSWSPDSQWLTYLKCPFKTDPGHDTADIWIARSNGSEKRSLTTAYPHVFATGFGRPPHYGNGSNMVQWSPVADAITHSRIIPGTIPPWVWADDRPDMDHFNRDYRPEQSCGGAQLCLLHPSGEIREITPAVERRWDFRAAWSRAGDQLAFIRSDVGGPGQLWVINADGSEARFLTIGEDDLGVDHPHFMPTVTI